VLRKSPGKIFFRVFRHHCFLGATSSSLPTPILPRAAVAWLGAGGKNRAGNVPCKDK
jgi:hypothetical protein